MDCEKCKELARLLLEARDALPAISMVSARLRNIDLSLADRIEAALEPWRIDGEDVPKPDINEDVACGAPHDR